MKNYIIFLFFFTVGFITTSAQTSAQNLDQASLLMQFKGTWEGGYGGKDTLLIWKGSPIAANKGLYSYAKVTYKEKILLEAWSLISFDAGIGKISWYELLSDGTVLPYQGEFSSTNTLLLYLYNNTDSKKIILKSNLHFRAEDVLDVTDTNMISGISKSYVLKRTAK
jgi:hypothetical protein